MAKDPSVILTDFKKVQIAPYVPQDKGLDIFALVMAKAQCVEQGIESDEEANKRYEDIKAKVHKYGISSKYIDQRQCLLSSGMKNFVKVPKKLKVKNKFIDFKLRPVLYKELYKNHTEPYGEYLDERMGLYEKIVNFVLKKVYEKSTGVPDDIIHVTCSGYICPSPVEKWVSEKEWLRTTVTHSYHMGCYGAIPGIRMAHGFMSSSFLGVASQKQRVDVVHTELLSIHFNILDDSPENLITSTLFADGFVKYSAVAAQADQQQRGFKILSLREHLLEDSLDDMTWNMGRHHFHMTLSINVPVAIRKAIREFMATMIARAGKDFDAIKEHAIFAIHPGGPKIVDYVKDELNLRDDQIRFSHDVFRNNGNMSSATIPCILSEILECKDVPNGTLVVAVAFGPGLTVAGALLEKI